MSEVTKLIPTRDGSRINIYIDDEYAFTIEKKLIEEFNLEVGITLDEEIQEKLKNLDLIEKLYVNALSKLTQRLFSTDEIRKYLLKKIKTFKATNPEKAEEKVIERLKNNELLNDNEFVDWFIDIKKSRYSIPEIRNKLRAKGVSNELINESLKNISPEENESVIQKLIEKKKRLLEYKKLDSKTLNKKIMEFLLRKGYKYSDISQAIKK